MKTILGVFTERDNAESAITALEEEGFRAKDMSIIMQDTSEGKVIADTTGANVVGSAATGATTGAVVGGLAGLLVGIGAIAIPGVGALLIGGPLTAALGLTGAAAATATGATTGLVAGGLIGALMGVGLPKEEAEVYESKIREGAILLAVPTDSVDEEFVRGIFADNGATDVTAVGYGHEGIRPTTRRAEVVDSEVGEEKAFVTKNERPYVHAGYKGGKVQNRRIARIRKNS